MDTRNKLFTIVGAVAITAAAGIGGYVLFATPDQRPTTSSSTVSNVSAATQPVPSTSSSTTATTATYKDGTYTASVSYEVPHGGQNTVDANLTIAGGKITSVDAAGNYTDRESGMYVDSFNSSVASDATGQSLDSYSPSRIGGASLTTAAFDSVLDTIRTKASA